MIVWLNGAFGAGKSTTAGRLLEHVPESKSFDPEYVGFMLRYFITEPVDDFQDWPAWRHLVPESVIQIHDHYQRPLIVPMTLLKQEYGKEILGRLRNCGIDFVHLVLHVNTDELVRRIEADQVEKGARDWRLRHVATYESALEWLSDDAHVIDTSAMSPGDVATTVVSELSLT